MAKPHQHSHILGATPLSSRPNWRITVSPFVLCLALTIGGCSGEDNPVGPSGPPPAGSTIKYTAIGASDANGIGSTVQCAPFTACPAGNGYVPVAERRLTALGYTVSLLNLGIPTAVISRRAQNLGQQYGQFVLGNFLESELPFMQPDATLVTVFAGPNDANTIRAAINGGAAGSDVNRYADQQVRAFSDDLTTLIDGVRSASRSARIVVLNLPNLAGLPYLAAASLADRRAAQRISVGMTTTAINPLTSRGVIVIDLMCDARFYQAATFSSDGFHPNDNGYRILADAVVAAATSASYPAPSSSCSFMSLVN